MKINEVITESKVSEAVPAGMFRQLGRKIAGKLGSVQGQASADVGDRANQIYKAFTNYALRAGIDPKATPKTELESWFASQGLTFPQVPATKRKMLNLTDKNVSTALWTAAAQQAYKGAKQTGTKLGKQYGISGADQSSPASSSEVADTPNFKAIKQAIPKLSQMQKHALGQLLLTP